VLGAYAAGGSDTIADPVQAKAWAGRALELFERGCSSGSGAACVRAGSMRERGEGTAADPGEALKRYEKACEGGYAPGCTAEGSCHAREMRSAGKAAKLFEKACAAGDGEGCLELAHLGGRAKDPLLGLARLLAGCMASSPSGQACHEANQLLGMAYEGCRMKQEKACKRSEQMEALARGADPAHGEPLLGVRAGEILAKACNEGDARACARLAHTATGPWVLGTLTRACDLGDPNGCAGVGTQLSSVFSSDTPHDPERAAGYFGRACDAGVVQACVDLGSLLAGAKKDPSVLGRSAALLQRGCEAGIGAACFERASLDGADARTRAAFEAKGRKALDAACAVDPWECHDAAQQTADAASAKRKNTIACEWGITHACAAIGAISFKPEL
jgi:TPR repeat protein